MRALITLTYRTRRMLSATCSIRACRWLRFRMPGKGVHFFIEKRQRIMKCPGGLLIARPQRSTPSVCSPTQSRIALMACVVTPKLLWILWLYPSTRSSRLS